MYEFERDIRIVRSKKGMAVWHGNELINIGDRPQDEAFAINVRKHCEACGLSPVDVGKTVSFQ